MLSNFPADALVLALDVGSSSVRAMILDREGKALKGVFAQIHYQPDTTPDGGSMIDADAMCTRIFRTIDEALEQAGDSTGRIGLVAMDTLVGNLMGVDTDGQPVTPIYTWADIRGSDSGNGWKAQLNAVGLTPDDYTQRTGARIHPSYWPLRLLWIQKHDPQAFAHAAYWMTIGEYLQFRLFGERRISVSVASWTGLLNRHDLDWDDTVLSTLPIQRNQLSTPSDEPFQGLSNEVAERWPALCDVPRSLPIGDGVASNIGAGCTTPGYVALSVGTSGALRIVVQGSPEVVPQGLFAYRVDHERTLVGGALSNAGNLFAWLLNSLKLPDAPDLEAAIAAMPPDSHGLTVLPFLAGERAPEWNPNAQAVFMGLTLDTTPEQIIRAGLEAVTYRFWQVADRLRPLLARDAVYVASGAAVLHSPAWMQIMADVLGASVYATTEHEATIRGTVFLATGHEPPPHLGTAYDPHASPRKIYAAAIERQQALYKRLLD